ncbi:hypothetical protein [Celeribacter sp. SCSIO 80788]|uniref:hypothetical protein n=1 Tax=Celeribacter sp. SCSIO 80788 TaxID=3117013 RepID=UPI003DA4C711
MAVYEIQGPDGKVYEVDAPDMQTAVSAMGQFTGGTQQSEKGFGQKAKEFLLGDDDPTTQNMGEKIGSFLNKAGESMTFGLVGDEADAAVAGMIPGGKSYDERLAENRQQQALFEQENPGAALAADIGGGLLGVTLPFGTIGTLSRGANLGARVAASTAAGAGMGATYGFMEGEGGEDRIRDARTGAFLGGGVGMVAPAAGAGIQRAMDGRAARRAISSAARNAPTTEALRAQGNAAYQAIDDAGVQIKPEAFERTRQRIAQMLRENTGFDELPGPGSLTPNSARASQIMNDASQSMATDPTAALPFRSLDQMRRQAGAAAGNVTNKTDQRAGMEIIGGLDDFVQRMGPDDVVSGDVKALQDALPKARDIWSRMSRSQTIDDAIDASENYLSGGSSGIRNQFSRILKNKKLSSSFSDAEIAAMRRVVNGTASERVLNLLGGGLGQLGQIGAGFGLGGPFGAAIGAGTGMLARKGSEAVSRKNAEIVRALVANGGMQTLPVATDGTRKIVESLLRRGAATGQ